MRTVEITIEEAENGLVVEVEDYNGFWRKRVFQALDEEAIRWAFTAADAALKAKKRGKK